MVVIQSGRRNIKRKEKFFKRNGGLLLQQQLSSSEVTVEKTTKLFNSKDLEKATNNFNVNIIDANHVMKNKEFLLFSFSYLN